MQCFADLVDRGIQAVIEVDEGIFRPEFLAEFFTSDCAGALQEQKKQLKGLVLQAHSGTTLAEFLCAGVDLKDAEARYATGAGLCHRDA